MYGWTHEIEHISGSCRQIWVRISHPEATYGILVWSKAHAWENYVEKVLGVIMKNKFQEIFENFRKMLKMQGKSNIFEF